MNMKKLFALLLALCMVLSLCACGSGKTEEETTEETVETTAAPTETAAEETEAEETLAEGMAVYTVTVVDADGNPIAGAMVQICQDTCYPSVTNEDGVAQWTVAEAEYKVSFLSMPEGYTCEEEAFYFAEGSNEMTITLNAAA